MSSRCTRWGGGVEFYCCHGDRAGSADGDLGGVARSQRGWRTPECSGSAAISTAQGKQLIAMATAGGTKSRSDLPGIWDVSDDGTLRSPTLVRTGSKSRTSHFWVSYTGEPQVRRCLARSLNSGAMLANVLRHTSSSPRYDVSALLMDYPGDYQTDIPALIRTQSSFMTPAKKR